MMSEKEKELLDSLTMKLLEVKNHHQQFSPLISVEESEALKKVNAFAEELERSYHVPSPRFLLMKCGGGDLEWQFSDLDALDNRLDMLVDRIWALRDIPGTFSREQRIASEVIIALLARLLKKETPPSSLSPEELEKTSLAVQKSFNALKSRKSPEEEDLFRRYELLKGPFSPENSENALPPPNTLASLELERKMHELGIPLKQQPKKKGPEEPKKRRLDEMKVPHQKKKVPEKLSKTKNSGRKVPEELEIEDFLTFVYMMRHHANKKYGYFLRDKHVVSTPEIVGGLCHADECAVARGVAQSYGRYELFFHRERITDLAHQVYDEMLQNPKITMRNASHFSNENCSLRLDCPKYPLQEVLEVWKTRMECYEKRNYDFLQKYPNLKPNESNEAIILDPNMSKTQREMQLELLFKSAEWAFNRLCVTTKIREAFEPNTLLLRGSPADVKDPTHVHLPFSRAGIPDSPVQDQVFPTKASSSRGGRRTSRSYSRIRDEGTIGKFISTKGTSKATEVTIK